MKKPPAKAPAPETKKGGRRSDDPKRVFTLRISEDMALRATKIADEHRVTDSEIYRFMIEAGIALAEREGLGAVMEMRREWFASNPMG